jgi:uncharacterized SAM-binding protein YcdF (DUF218 family)
MFFLKKLVSTFLMPLTAAVVLLLVGLALSWFSRRQRAGRIVATAGLAVLLVFSLDGVADLLLTPLEGRYEALYPRERLETLTVKAGRRPRWVVVLGSGHTFDRRIPPTSQLSAGALSRLVEGVRLHRELPDSKLLLLGGIGQSIKHAEVLGAAARSFGIPDENIVIDVTPWDTEQEAAAVARRLGTDEDFLLVTSGYHMPRAVGLFKKRGLRPVPAPTDHQALSSPGVSWRNFFPRPSALQESERATHEYVGYLWSRLRGRL